jgi:hypothetical protein
MTRPPRVVHLDELEAMPGPGTLTWHPVRAHLLSFGGPATFTPSAWEWMFRAVALAESDPARAREVVQDGLEKHPESPGMRIALARVLLQEGDEAGARAALRDALERQPDAEDYVREVPELAALL